MRYRGAILDDYTDVARQVADWSKIPEVEFRTFTKPIGSTQELIEALQGEVARLKATRNPRR